MIFYKNIIISFVIVGSFFVLKNNIYAQDSVEGSNVCESCRSEFTFTLGSGELNVSGYQDAVFNDNAYYSGSATGATYVPFSDANGSGSVTQMDFGFNYLLTDYIGSEHILNINYGVASADKTTASIFTIGYSYHYDLGNFLEGTFIRPGIGIGSTSVKTDLGTVQDVGTMPVIISDGTFQEGAAIESEASGSALKYGFDLGYMVTSQIFALLKLNLYSLSYSDPVTKIDGTEITDRTAFDEGYYNGSTIVYDSGSNINPFEKATVSYKPPMITLGIGYKF